MRRAACREGSRTAMCARGVHARLKAALDLLPEEYSFLIYDTLRPLRVQEALFEEYIEVLKKEHPQADREELEEICDEFVAKPSKNQLRPSSHQSGGAVDLTLCRDGAPLDMGTAFDEFCRRLPMPTPLKSPAWMKPSAKTAACCTT